MGKKKRIVTLVTVHAILILLVFTALFPIALVVLNSFKPHVAIVANPLSWPEKTLYRSTIAARGAMPSLE